MAKRTHLLDHDVRRLTSFLRCGWFKGHRIDDRDERSGRVTAHHRNISDVPLDLQTTTHLDEVDCKRCLKAVEHHEHPALDNPERVLTVRDEMRAEFARGQRLELTRRHQEFTLLGPLEEFRIAEVEPDDPIEPAPMPTQRLDINWAQPVGTDDLTWRLSTSNVAAGYYQVDAVGANDVTLYTTTVSNTSDTTLDLGYNFMATGDYYWDRWVTSDNTTATTTANDTVWNYWNVGTTTNAVGTTLTTDDLWATWVTLRDAPLAPANVYGRELRQNDEYLAAIDAGGRQVTRRGAGRQYTQREHDDYERRRAERREEMQKAERIAEELLVAHLPTELAEMWQANQELVIEGQSGTRYGVKKGRIHNIVELDDEGKEVSNLCALPKGNDGEHLPDGDVLLGQILHLKHNEEEFRKVANITRPYGDRLWTPRVVEAGRQDEAVAV